MSHYSTSELDKWLRGAHPEPLQSTIETHMDRCQECNVQLVALLGEWKTVDMAAELELMSRSSVCVATLSPDDEGNDAVQLLLNHGWRASSFERFPTTVAYDTSLEVAPPFTASGLPVDPVRLEKALGDLQLAVQMFPSLQIRAHVDRGFFQHKCLFGRAVDFVHAQHKRLTTLGKLPVGLSLCKPHVMAAILGHPPLPRLHQKHN